MTERRGKWRFIRAQDFVWLLLFGALHAASPVKNAAELELLIGLALFQVLSPRIGYLATQAGNVVAISVKLLLGYLLIGVTYGVESSYYPILLLPVVSAATTLGAAGTVVFTGLACASYLSYLLFIDWTRFEVPLNQMRELALRCLFFPLVGYLTFQLAEANRVEALRYQAAAADLKLANRNLEAAEAAVRRSERLAALGQLTAGLAHELRNPLGTIKNSAEVLTGRVGGGDAVSGELAGFISSEVDRTNSLITRFLEFARPMHLRISRADLAPVIDRAIARAPSPGVTVLRNDDPGVVPVEMDVELIEQALLNLISNAVQASPPSGVVTVKTRSDAGGVEVAVIDRGAGIPAHERESIFNPFFTTKNEGIGLGLAIVSKIVDEHRGRIGVESEPGRGSIFRVWLPERQA